MIHMINHPAHRFVVAHNPNWITEFANEVPRLQRALGLNVTAIHHIGSTSITGILAKPIVDILVEVTTLTSVDQRTIHMRKLGYEVMGAYGIKGRRYFRKSNTQGARTHHIHVYAIGSPHIKRHLAFRDYLIAHPKKAQEYSQLKASLTQNIATSRDKYIDGKDPFIKAVEIDALIWSRSQS